MIPRSAPHRRGRRSGCVQRESGPERVRGGQVHAIQKSGFQARERVIDGVNGGTEIGAWMSVNALGHEMAIMRDQTGARGRLHHLAFWYGIPQHNADAAELCRERGIQIEAGPDVHGITQGAFLYVFEPGGHRIELFGNSGILQFEPDYETVTSSRERLPIRQHPSRAGPRNCRTRPLLYSSS